LPVVARVRADAGVTWTRGARVGASRRWCEARPEVAAGSGHRLTHRILGLPSRALDGTLGA